MGNQLYCCNRTVNNNKNKEKEEEIINNMQEDYIIITKNNNNFEEFDIPEINPELPLDFPYSKDYFNGDDTQKEFLLNDISNPDEEKIYNINELKEEESTKLKELLEYCNTNGKPRSSDDFDQKGWAKFYSKVDPFFIIKDEENNTHNQLKIKNEKDKSNMEIYIGDLNIYGQKNGIGKFITPYFSLIGMWKEDKFSGWGRESRCNGDVFEGRYENGLLSGKGIFLNAKNDKYIGDFKYMRRWGKGKLATNKFIYEGDFYNNDIHGKGQIIFIENEAEYKGSFQKNKISGKGVFTWKNGDRYEGEVQNGLLHGLGKYIYKNGKIFEGIFYKGQKIKIKEEKEKKDICLLSTYRNFGFIDVNDDNINFNNHNE